MAIIVFDTHPTDQLSLFEIFHVTSECWNIHFGAPFFVGLQVNVPYLMIVSVPYNNLLRTDHLNRNMKTIFTFHVLPE